MEIKGAKEMVKYRDVLLANLENEYIKLDNLSRFPLKDVEEKTKIYERINVIKDKLDYIQRIMYAGANFKTEEFVYFLNSFLKLIESNYIVTKIRVADSNIYFEESLSDKIKRRKAWKNKKRINTVKGKWCYFISDEISRETILENIFDDEDLDVYKNSKVVNDVMIMDSFNTYPFYSNFKMKKGFASNPKIKTAIYELIDLKIKNPELTDEERFNIVLNNTKRRIAKKKNNTYQKKKEV